MQNYENATVGKEKPKLKPDTVIVEDYEVQENVKDKNDKDLGTRFVLLCRHPAKKDELVKISKIKYEKLEKVKTEGLWLNLDDDGTLPYNSAIANLLRFAEVENISQLVGKTFKTVYDDNEYLVIKAY